MVIKRSTFISSNLLFPNAYQMFLHILYNTTDNGQSADTFGNRWCPCRLVIAHAHVLPRKVKPLATNIVVMLQQFELYNDL